MSNALYSAKICTSINDIIQQISLFVFHINKQHLLRILISGIETAILWLLFIQTTKANMNHNNAAKKATFNLLISIQLKTTLKKTKVK